MSAQDSYRSPLEERYASDEMRSIWSAQRKFSTWRHLWLALAEAQRELGLNITRQQVEDLREHLDDIDFDAAARYEAQLHHDVMAHIRALGDVAPEARPIIHLGATSQDIVCNADLILLRDALRLTARRLAAVIDALGRLASRHRALPTLGMTHFQPAQPTTVGKRAALWAYDFVLALEDLEHRLAALRPRGIRGATGTQASFLALFGGDHEKVERLEALVCRKMGWPEGDSYAVTGQTYPRLVDAQVLGALAAAASAVCKCGNDIRLMCGRREADEPFGRRQVGSSSMPYKRNPMRCERATGLARFVMALPASALATASTQWLERTLDDSANRRLTLPEGFLALDGALLTMREVAEGLVIYERVVRANLEQELPFLLTENILMAAVAGGADRQEAHEILRRHSIAAAERLKLEGGPNDLLSRLKGEPVFAGVPFDGLLRAGEYVGRAPEQVDRFVGQVVEPLRRRYGLGPAAAVPSAEHAATGL
jgi:adenylosuccinate lyase